MQHSHIEFLVEEASMQAFLAIFLQKQFPNGNVTWRIHIHNGKKALLKQLEGRLRGYKEWLPHSHNYRVVIVVDRDNQDCHNLKQKLEGICCSVGLISRTQAGGNPWQVACRIAIEEMESWYFGDWLAVQAAYPKVSQNIPKKSGYRDPDAIGGGTWETLGRILKRHNYYPSRLHKTEAARKIAQHIDPQRNTSQSFQALYKVILEAAG